MIDGLSNKLCIAVVIRSHIFKIYIYTYILVDRNEGEWWFPWYADVGQRGRIPG